MERYSVLNFPRLTGPTYARDLKEHVNVDTYEKDKDGYKRVSSTERDISMNGYMKVAVAGTFDHLHDGHRALLSAAMACVAPHGSLLIGITDVCMLGGKQYAARIYDWERRKEDVVGYIRTIGTVDMQVFRLYDAYGPILSDGTIDLLVTSEETCQCIGPIASKRSARLDFAVVPLLQDAKGDKLSSTTIRHMLEDV